MASVTNRRAPTCRQNKAAISPVRNRTARGPVTAFSPPGSCCLWANDGIARFGMLSMGRILMVPLVAVRNGFVYSIVLALLTSSVSSVSAQDEARANQRLELMQAAVNSLELEPAESKPKPALTFASKPLLRYSDPTRGGITDAAVNVLLDASVWRLGTEGRPTALVTVEIYQAPD